MTYKSVEETAPDEAEEQILLRLDLLHDMVGTLYPSILYDEISRLGHRKYEQWYFSEDL